MSLSRELEFALEAVAQAADVAMERFGGELQTKRKGDGTWATEADVATEETLRGLIAKAYPEHNILGEEGGLSSAGGGAPVEGAPTWVIDPIDGTNNYMAAIPIWATLLGLRHGDETVVGVVHAPAISETYHGATGEGAYMNGSPISVDDITSLDDALVVHAGVWRLTHAGYGEAFARILENARRDRGFGDFWGHMLVARGAASAMIEPELSVWDVAALQPIVSEAGGRLTTFAGEPWIDAGSVLTTNGNLHDELVGRLKRSQG